MQQIESAVSRFVAELSEILNRQALEAVAQAFGSPRSSSSTAAAPRARREAPTPLRQLRWPKGQKRSPAELERLTADLLSHVKRNPNQRIEEIAAAMGAATKDLALPVRKLLADRSIRSTGQKRATRYQAR